MARYRVQAKVRDRGSNTFKLITYKTDNLKSFALFLNRSFEYWTYLNVYEYVPHDKGRLLASFTHNNPPNNETLR